jgi:hypothetical protein
MLKGLGSSNPLLSASQSEHFAYILEKAETPREMRRSFRPQRTGESWLMPGSPDSAIILSVRNKNGSLQRPELALGGVRPTFASARDQKFSGNCLARFAAFIRWGAVIAKPARAFSYAPIRRCRMVLRLKVGRRQSSRCACGAAVVLTSASRALGAKGLRSAAIGWGRIDPLDESSMPATATE